jgi:hypothetical protein
VSVKKTKVSEGLPRVHAPISILWCSSVFNLFIRFDCWLLCGVLSAGGGCAEEESCRCRLARTRGSRRPPPPSRSSSSPHSHCPTRQGQWVYCFSCFVSPCLLHHEGFSFLPSFLLLMAWHMASQVKPYASSKDWEKIESDIKQELEADKPEGEVSCLKSSFLSFPPHSLYHSLYHIVLSPRPITSSLT